MAAKILDGAALAQRVREEVAQEVARLTATQGVTPGLAAILIGDNPASATYVRNKERACAEAGIFTETFRLPRDASQSDARELVDSLGRDPQFHGILLQLPLPSHLDEAALLEAIPPFKDIDGLHPFNVGRLALGDAQFLPCTPHGIQRLLVSNGYDPGGKHVVICGRSNIVGKPLALLLMQKRPEANATVTLCHTATADLAEMTRKADILVAAMGRPSAITADMVKEGVVVIDVGMNRVPDESRRAGYRLVGDVEFEGVSEKAEAITPVPGGVGPMTIAMLLVNTLKAAKLSLGSR